MPANSSRREFLDTVVSVSAAVVAASALVVTAYQTKIMREQQKMSAWPRVEQTNTGGSDNYGRIVLNVGVGPAIVRSATLVVDGRPLHNWSEVFQAMAADTIPGARMDSLLQQAQPVTASVVRGRVLLPGSTTELIRLRAPLAGPLRRFFNSEHTRMRVCYCSVYGDCWVSDTRAPEPDPVEVAACPGEPGNEFHS